MEPSIFRPHEALTRFVEYFWTFDAAEGETGRTLKMFATGVSGILFQHRDGQPALGATPDGRPVSHGGCPTSFVFGKRTRPMQTFANGAFGLTGVVFTPQGLGMLLKTRPEGLSDRSAELDAFSREHLGEQLRNACGHGERVARLATFLRAHVDGAAPEDRLVTESLRLIRDGIRSIRVPQLLTALGISERQFERRFVRAIGVPPHQFLRIARFRQALRLLKSHQFERLSDVAYDLNYADQSHLIKDVKAFSGYTPGRLVEAVRSAVQLPCALILARNDGLPTARGDTLTGCGYAPA